MASLFKILENLFLSKNILKQILIDTVLFKKKNKNYNWINTPTIPIC